MKSVILPIIILLAFAGFASTVKNDKKEMVRSQQLKGEWTGSYSVEDGPFVNPLIFQFSGEKLEVSDGPKEWGDKASGTYYLSGDTLVAKYKFREGLQHSVTISAVIKGNTIEGSWEWVKGKGRLVLNRGADTVHQQKTTVR